MRDKISKHFIKICKKLPLRFIGGNHKYIAYARIGRIIKNRLQKTSHEYVR